VRFEVLFLSLCTREKGLFDTVEATIRANELLASKQVPIRVHLTVAGRFWREEEKEEYERLIAGAAADLAGGTIRYVGFVAGEQKEELLRNSDCLCFPSYYQAESVPVVIIEAMSCGLPVITTRWRGIPEILPEDYEGFVPPRSARDVAERLLKFMVEYPGAPLRKHYEERLTIHQTLSRIRSALLELESDHRSRP
jgi:glycosyltransferase involved in cell wall biosynthesis